MKSQYILNAKAAEVLEALIEGLPVGGARKIDNGHGYMAVNVDRLSEKRWAIAHVYIQEGDCMSDPDVEVIKVRTGFMPTAFDQSGVIYIRAVELDGQDQPTGFRDRALRDLVSFCNDWLGNNIRDQQGGLAAIRESRKVAK